MKTDLSSYNNSWYAPGSAAKRMLWYFVNVLFLRNTLNPSSGIRVFWLRVFGARLGSGVVIKPGVNIKYPWKLSIGDHCWLGEGVWIDNLAQVTLESHVCISQGAYLFCGNHDYKKPTFDLIVKSIRLCDGSWVGAGSVVCPGVTVGSHAVLAVGAVATQDLAPYTIYQGNPAIKVRERLMEGGK